MSIIISEEMGVQKEWYSEAKEITPDKLSDFISHLIKDYRHDYGTICHAVASAAIGAANAVDNSEQGGITGFQASAVMWEFITHWMHYDNQPMRLMRFEDMLYPQYEYRLKSISRDTYDWLISEAWRNIRTDGITERATWGVIEHWNEVAHGYIPGGFCVYDE